MVELVGFRIDQYIQMTVRGKHENDRARSSMSTSLVFHSTLRHYTCLSPGRCGSEGMQAAYSETQAGVPWRRGNNHLDWVLKVT